MGHVCGRGVTKGNWRCSNGRDRLNFGHVICHVFNANAHDHHKMWQALLIVPGCRTPSGADMTTVITSLGCCACQG